MPVTGWPKLVVQVSTQTAATRVTPGTVSAARSAAGSITAPGVCTMEALTIASAPAACHEALTSPLLTAVETMPANAATLSAMTRANAGSAGVSRPRAARARPMNAGAPARRAAPRSATRSTSG